MKIERTKNTVRNSAWGIVNKIIATFFPVIVRTLIVQYIGAAYLGLGSLFSSILTVLSLAELGVSSAIVFSMYKPIAEDDTTTICALMALYKKLYSMIGTIIGIIGLVLMPFLSCLIKGDYPSDINLYFLYLIYLGNTVIGYFLFAYKNCLLTAYQRTDISTKIGIVTSVVQYIVTIFVIIWFRNYYIYVFLAPITSIVNNLLTAYCVDRIFPDYRARGNLGKKEIAGIKKRVAGLMLGKLSGTARDTFDSIFISAFSGLTAVAIYGNYYYIMAAIIGFLVIVTASMSAGIGNSVAMECQEKNHDDLMKYTFGMMWGLGWCSICFGCLYHNTMMIWMGPELTMPETLSWIFALYFYVRTMSSMNELYYNASGLWWYGKWARILETIFNLLLNYFLGKKYGIYGIIIASIITTVVIGFNIYTVTIYNHYFTNYKIKENYIMHMGYGLVTVFAAAITRMICNMISEENFVTLIARCGICIFVPNLIYWFAYRRTKYYGEMLRIARKVVRNYK